MGELELGGSRFGTGGYLTTRNEAMRQPQNVEEFESILADAKAPVIIGFFGDFSATARRAQPMFEAFCAGHKDHPSILVDVGQVKGVHKRLGVSSVPTVVLVDGSTVLQKVAGVQTDEYYERALLMPSTGANTGTKDDKPHHNTVLYVGASCPWCTRARNYLRKQRVQFREIDISKNQGEADRLVSRSGNKGVPQLNIDGHWVVGFDKPKINKLLGLTGE